MNNRIVWQVTTMLGLAIAATTVSAADAPGFYIGAGIGEAVLEFDDFDDGDTAVKVFGGYSINESFAVELSYTDGGTAEESSFSRDLKVDTTIVNLSLVGALPLIDTFSLFGKIGYASIDVEVESTGFFDVISADATEEALSYGAGVVFNVRDTWGIRAEYEGYDIDDGNLNVFSINGLFRF
jgi:OOP family OmpA-OmpF porin